MDSAVVLAEEAVLAEAVASEAVLVVAHMVAALAEAVVANWKHTFGTHTIQYIIEYIRIRGRLNLPLILFEEIIEPIGIAVVTLALKAPFKFLLGTQKRGSAKTKRVE